MKIQTSGADDLLTAERVFAAAREIVRRFDTRRNRRLVRGLGMLLTFVCGAFVAQFLYRQWTQLRGLQLSASIVGAGLGAVLIYLIAAVGVALGWRELMQALGVRLSPHLAFVLVWRTQLAKYLPSNVVQYGGRILLARWCGIQAPAKITGGTLILEVALTAMVCLIIAAPLLLRSLWLTLVGIGGLIAALSVLGMTCFMYARVLKAPERTIQTPGLIRGVLVAALFYALVIILLAAGLFIIVQRLDPRPISWAVFVNLFSSTALAWLAGMAAVGSPAGLGVREAVLLASLQAQHAPAAVAVAVVLHRISTTIGDCAAFALTFIYPPREMRGRIDSDAVMRGDVE